MNKNRKGFTLVELIVVVTIFGVILGAILNMIKPANNVYHDADAPGAAPVLRSGHAGAVQGLRPAQLLHDLCHERRDLFHHLLCRAAAGDRPGLVHVLHHPAGSVLLGGQCRSWRGGGLSAALQHRGCGLCDDRHVHGDLSQPVGKGPAALQRPDRPCRPIGVSGGFWLQQLFAALHGMHSDPAAGSA